MRAQVVHALELGAGQVEASRLGARREQRGIEPDALAALEHDLAGARLDRGDRHAEAQLDLLVAIAARGR